MNASDAVKKRSVAMGNSLSSQYKAVRLRETVLVESELENIHWCISVDGDTELTGQGKVILTTQGLHLFNNKHSKGAGNQSFPISSIISAETRPKRSDDVESSPHEQHLAICLGGRAASEDDGHHVPQIRMMDETSGRSPRNVKAGTEICLRTDDHLLLSNILQEIEGRAGVARNPEHYLERMLHSTSGRVARTQRFMLHYSSGRIESSGSSEGGEEGADVTTDMMRFTSGRVPRPPRFSADDEH
jgi:hypothetical protein